MKATYRTPSPRNPHNTNWNRDRRYAVVLELCCMHCRGAHVLPHVTQCFQHYSSTLLQMQRTIQHTGWYYSTLQRYYLAHISIAVQEHRRIYLACCSTIFSIAYKHGLLLLLQIKNVPNYSKTPRNRGANGSDSFRSIWTEMNSDCIRSVFSRIRNGYIFFLLGANANTVALLSIEYK